MSKKSTKYIQSTTRLKDGWQKTKATSKRAYNRTSVFLNKNPLRSFFLAIALLFVAIIIGHVLQRTPQTAQIQAPKKTVAVYSIGESPKATFQAKVEKTGVVQIYAQTAGVVQNINVKEGDSVAQGQTLITLSNNYQGGNAPAIQTQIAQSSYQNVLDTYGLQNELIQKQRDTAKASADNAQINRDIANAAAGETDALIQSNQSQLDQINQTITSLQANNTNGANDEQIQLLQGNANQLQGGVNQLKEALRNAQNQAQSNNPPAILAGLQKDIALKQLDVQEKSLVLNKEVSRLQVSLAYVSEATMYPATPFAGTVERINVHPGQIVSPGTLLATVTGNDVKTSAILLVPQQVAAYIANGDPSTFTIGNKSFSVTPYHVANEATDGQLFAATYALPSDAEKLVTNGEYVSVQVPIGTVKTTAADPLVPIDAVYISSENAQVLVVKNDKAVSKTIKLGNVYGNYVEVVSGLSSGDQIITDRNVIAGDSVTMSAAR